MQLMQSIITLPPTDGAKRFYTARVRAAAVAFIATIAAPTLAIDGSRPEVFVTSTLFDFSVPNAIETSTRRYTGNGDFVDSFGQIQGAFPSHIATDGANLFVSDGKSREVNIYSPAGEFLRTFVDLATYLNAPAPLGVYPIELDSQGFLYAVHDAAAGVAARFSPEGAFLAAYSHPDFFFPSGIDSDGAANVYIANRGRIYKFDVGGAFIARYDLPPQRQLTYDLSIDELGRRLFVATPGRGVNPDTITVFDISGATPQWILSIPTPGFVNGMSYDPASGHVFVADNSSGIGDNPAFELALDGTIVRTFNSAGQGLPWDVVRLPNRIPEPSTLALLVLGVTALGVRLRAAI